MFNVTKHHTNYVIEFDDPETFKLIIDNDETNPTCSGYKNSLSSVLNRIQGVAMVYWEDTEDLFKDERGFMYIDIFDCFCHEQVLDTVEEHICRFIDFWKDNGNA